MAAIKAKCPMCGGTVIIPEGKTFGECDSCAVQFSLSDLQKYKEQTGQAEHTEPEGVDIDGDGLLDYTTALSTDNIIHESVAELCKKAEVALQAEMWSLVYRFCDEIIRRDPHYAKAYLYKLLADCRIYKKEALADSKKLFDTNENYRLLIRFADTYLAAEIESYLTTARNRLAEAQSEEKYQMLCRDMRNADSENVLRRLIKSFQELGDYRDSEKRKQECEDRLKRQQAKNATKKGVTIAVFALIAAAIIGGIIAIIAAIAGAISAHSASYDKSYFTVEITDKSNDDYDDSTVRVIFDIDFTNNTSHNATRIVGYLKVKDCDGNILTNGDAHFDGEFLPSIRDDWTLTWRMSRNDDSAELWNTRFELLEILFCITELRFEDGTVRNYEIEDVVVKPYDTAYADKQYAAATTCFDNGEYAEAQELFEKLRGYKDSEDRAAECKREATRIEMANKEEQYLSAKNMVAEGDYLGAVKLLKELDDYRDSADLLELIENNLADVALEYSIAGDYRKAVELIESFGYSLDSWNIPDDIYDVLKANKNAIDGSYTKLVSLGITNIIIPEGTTVIKDSAFKNATALKSVTLPTTVTAIGEGAFYGCSSMTSINLPGGLTGLGKNAFYGCSSLTSIQLPEGLVSLGDYAFYSCTGLSSIAFPESLTTIGHYAFSYCPGITELKLPDKLVSIGEGAFRYCSGIRIFTVPDSVTSIGAYALDKCTSLTEVTMPVIDGFTVKNLFENQIPETFVRVNLTKGEMLGNRYLYKCDTLKEINLPSRLKIIGEESLAYCAATKINIPETVTEIRSGAFLNCSSLTSINLPGGLTGLGENAFYECSSLTSIKLPEGLVSLGDYTFYSCTGLSSVAFPESLITIGHYAFSHCSGITELKLPDKLVSIGEGAFSYCSGIRKFTIPDSVTFIGEYALDRCTSLIEITMPVIDGFMVKSLFEHQVPETFVRVNLTKGETLGKRYFYNCRTLVEINLPEQLKVLGEESLAYCSATTINFPDTIKEIKSGAFRNSSITSFTLPTAITEIPDNLFAYSYLKTIHLHGNVTSIGASAFQGCSLTISFEGTKEKWESVSKDSLWNYSISSYTIICTDATYTYKYGTGSWK